MKIIGLDFGTTNSTISFYNAESKALDSFRLDINKDYIPSVISYDKNKDYEISIGLAAKQNITSEDFEVYEHFKLRLGRDFNKVIEGRTKTPNQVTHDFIKELLEKYKKWQNIDKIEYIVMTVPDIWFREPGNLTARENIEGMFKELGYGELKFQLQSEPVAAAAYFCRAYESDTEINPKRKKYSGFITVIDYGGGTLDVTLCEVKNDGSIWVLGHPRFSKYNNPNGCAGVAFDTAVVKKLIRDRNLPVQEGSKKFIKLRNKFEEGKITMCADITKGLKYYYDDKRNMKGKKLFSFDYNDDNKLDVYCEDLDLCFKEINAPKLNESLEQIQEFFPKYNIDSSNQENFRVLLVGGFSNFFAVEKTVREFFKSTTEAEDKRFEQPFPRNNRALSISLGAALIAADEITIVRTCEHSYGCILKEKVKSDQWVDKYVTVIEKGTDIKEFDDDNPRYIEDFTVQVWAKSGFLRIFKDDGRPNNAGRRPIKLDKSVKDMFPNLDDQNNEYRIGFSVNKNEIPTIHIKDNHEEVRRTSLNKLFEETQKQERK